MKKSSSVVLILLFLFILVSVPEMGKTETLGPLDFDNLDLENFDFVAIHSPQNITYNSGTVFVNFTSFGTVTIDGYYVLGYSLDGLPVERITNITELERKISATPSFELLRSSSNVTLSGLQDGAHSITVYMGYTFGQPDRYSVAAYDSMNFTVKARKSIQINNDGSVDGTDLLQRNDNTYTFLNDISGNIVILKDSITLDGAGFTLKGSGDSSEKGIDLSHKKNVTVTNLVVMDYFQGIFCRPGAGTATNITIQGNLIQNCDIGIEFQGTSNNSIKYNTFKNNSIDISINYVLGDNLITQNNIDSYVQVWMSDQPTINMNHWTAYNGTDNDEDGIGDSPYYYHEILQDNNPLMNPVPVIPEFPSWLILPLLIVATFSAIIVKKKLYKNLGDSLK